MLLTSQDFAIISLLIFLEGILSIDNALVIALLAKGLPKDQQKKALSYGLIGAFVFRIGAISMAAWLMKWTWVKYVGGAYLIWVAAKDLFFKKSDKEEAKATRHRGFWKTVILIELMDIAFAVDSILAAVAMTPKIEVVIIGGVSGMILMRFAASIFIGFLERFPRFEKTAYLLVGLVGIKLVVEGMQLPFVHFHDPKSPAFILFWLAMILSIANGFRPVKKTSRKSK